MNGINRITGKKINGWEHIRQSIIDILTTPKGSRVMRRDYGSDLFLLIDQPLNDENILRIKSEAIQAIEKWEKRIKILMVDLTRYDNTNKITLYTDKHNIELALKKND